MLGRLAVRYSEVPVVFAGSRKFAEEWTFRFFGAAVGDHPGEANLATTNLGLETSAREPDTDSDRSGR